MQSKLSLRGYYTILESVHSVHFLKEIFFIFRVTAGVELKPNNSQEASCWVQFSSFQHNYANPSLTLQKGQ
jgi:hypothetical protein